MLSEETINVMLTYVVLTEGGRVEEITMNIE